MVKALRGLILNPVLVAFARGMAEAAAMAALLFAGEALTSANIKDEWQLAIPVLTFLLRQAEGLADKIDPAKQRRREILRESPLTDEDGNPA